MSMVTIGHFGDESLQSITCTGTDKPEQPRQNTCKTQTNATHKMALINNTKHSKTLGSERGQTEPGLVTFYVIQSGNGAGLFLQPGTRMG